MLENTISILIVDFDIEVMKNSEKVHTKWQIREQENLEKILTDDLEIHIINLKNARKQLKENKEDTLSQWLAFLDNPNRKEVLEMKKTNKEIADALWKLEEISEDEKIKRMAWYKEKWALDEASAREYSKKKGKSEAQKEIAKKMKEKFDVETIMEMTGLTLEEIEKL